MFKGKRFQDNNNHEIVNVTDENSVWVTLADGRNIKTTVFQQRYSEFLEVDDFFTNDAVMENLAQQFTNNLNNISSTNTNGSGVNAAYSTPKPPINQPAGYYIDEKQLISEQAKKELLDKFNNTYRPPAVQYDAIDMSQIGRENNNQQQPLQRRERPKYIPPEESETIIKDANTGAVLYETQVKNASYSEETESNPNIYDLYKQQPVQEPIIQQPVQEPIIQQSVQEPIIQQPVQEPIIQQPVQEPIIQQPVQQPIIQQPVQVAELSLEEESFRFFKKFKKTYPVKIEISFDEMIAGIDYVKQTALNYEGDIVKYYTKELMNKILVNPSILEEQIYTKYKNIILPDET